MLAETLSMLLLYLQLPNYMLHQLTCRYSDNGGSGSVRNSTLPNSDAPKAAEPVAIPNQAATPMTHFHHLTLSLVVMASAQRPSTKPHTQPLHSGQFWLFAPIAGYWLLAAIVLLVRPNSLDLLLLGPPLAALSVVVLCEPRQRRRLSGGHRRQPILIRVNKIPDMRFRGL